MDPYAYAYQSNYLGRQQYPEAVGSRLLCSGKQQWPELVGKPGCEAASIIIRENSNADPIVLPAVGNFAITGDLSCNRVRVFIDNNGNVNHTPYVG